MDPSFFIRLFKKVVHFFQCHIKKKTFTINNIIFSCGKIRAVDWPRTFDVIKMIEETPASELQFLIMLFIGTQLKKTLKKLLSLSIFVLYQ